MNAIQVAAEAALGGLWVRFIAGCRATAGRHGCRSVLTICARATSARTSGALESKSTSTNPPPSSIRYIRCSLRRSGRRRRIWRPIVAGGARETRARTDVGSDCNQTCGAASFATRNS